MREEKQHCTVAGCTETATHKKLYCIKHLDRLPYVKHLQAIEEIRQEEVEKARAGSKDINVKSSRSKEILIQLAIKGAVSPKRLAVIVETEPTVVNAYLDALDKYGYVSQLTVGSRRGTPRQIVTVTDKGRKFIQPDIDHMV